MFLYIHVILMPSAHGPNFVVRSSKKKSEYLLVSMVELLTNLQT